MNLDKIIAIADALGWERSSCPTWGMEIFIHDDMPTVVFDDNGPAPCALVTFATCAKAEMAKRGWASITNIYDTPDGLIIMGRVWGEFDGLISEVEVLIGDPTDPISEANALIDAIYAALEMEGA